MKTCECQEKFPADALSQERMCRRCGGYIVPEEKPERAAIVEGEKKPMVVPEVIKAGVADAQ